DSAGHLVRALALDLARARDPDLARDLVRAHALATDLTRALARARDLTRDLDRYRAIELASALADSYVRALAFYRVSHPRAADGQRSAVVRVTPSARRLLAGAARLAPRA